MTNRENQTRKYVLDSFWRIKYEKLPIIDFAKNAPCSREQFYKLLNRADFVWRYYGVKWLVENWANGQNITSKMKNKHPFLKKRAEVETRPLKERMRDGVPPLLDIFRVNGYPAWLAKILGKVR